MNRILTLLAALIPLVVLVNFFVRLPGRCSDSSSTNLSSIPPLFPYDSRRFIQIPDTGERAGT